MARLPYADLNNPAIHDLVTQIEAERGSVIHLYQMLLHSPAVAQGWLNHLTGIRLKSQVSGDLRELIIMRVAIINRAPYEADQHAPIALKEGVTQEQLDALPNWQDHTDLFSDKEQAVLAYTDAMTRDIQVPNAVYEAIATQFDAQTVVELTATIATYNMVSRFLEALHIHSDDINHTPIP
ncbi:carboxymuconolactone decarboxylase family protein [Paenalcaligenes hominis]|uniref:AhpD family alkylhydroperoxidase n=1 Tax=Paenalcaligenes hominis TaxID=643674 RepID=A0ABX0WQC9_9BURK|nr:carboxymuconolactone decarboxylase family protein [Paenalcaligenes hominis]NJB64923.1 AhpD family alkylhydroperoxidase [Paenalcaligenes hominis]GGE58052.1 carboxymuconolactone decarboxylase [Paenalcaligenes hominis]